MKVAEPVMVIMMSLLCVIVLATCTVASEAVVPPTSEACGGVPEAIDFDGFEMDLRAGQADIARALRTLPSSELSAQDELPVDLLVTGPSSNQAGRGAISAEVGQQFSFLSIAGGMLADRNSIFAGPAGWTSRLAMEFEGATTSGGVELRTQLRQTTARQTVGIELGPRLEQRLPRGIKLFFEGSAQARAEYDRLGELTPTGGPLQQPEVIGLSGTVGITR